MPGFGQCLRSFTPGPCCRPPHAAGCLLETTGSTPTHQHSLPKRQYDWSSQAPPWQYQGDPVEILALALPLPVLAASAVGYLMLRPFPFERGAGNGRDVTREQGSMMVAVLIQVCLSTAPLWLSHQSTDSADVGEFVAVNTYIRAPLLLITGLTSIVLSGAAAAYAKFDRGSVVKWIAVGLTVSTVFGASSVALLTLVADSAFPLLFGFPLPQLSLPCSGYLGSPRSWLSAAQC